MSAQCCRSLIGDLRSIPSPFSRVVATGYYDGATDGLVECGTCATVYVFHKLDWDEKQDMRVFALSPVFGRAFAELERAGDDKTTPRWPVWVLGGESTDVVAGIVEQMYRAASPEEFIVATTNLLSRIEVWRPVGLQRPIDWFRELNLDRQGLDE